MSYRREYAIAHRKLALSWRKLASTLRENDNVESLLPLFV